MGTPFIGEIRMFGGNFAILGWAFCDGSLLSIAQNDALYALLGTTYGGDGQNTFALPDLRSRVPVHQGTGAGLSSYTLGQMGGAETVTLTTATIPAHSHAAKESSAGSGSSDPTGNFWASSPTTKQYATTPTPNTFMASNATSSAGGGSPHDNMVPFLAVSFIIAIQGLYPSQ